MDIAITWNVRAARGDWPIVSSDLALDNPLKSAVMVSLFTDRVAPQQPSSDDMAAGSRDRHRPGARMESARLPAGETGRDGPDDGAAPDGRAAARRTAGLDPSGQAPGAGIPARLTGRFRINPPSPTAREAVFSYGDARHG